MLVSGTLVLFQDVSTAVLSIPKSVLKAASLRSGDRYSLSGNGVAFLKMKSAT